MENQLYSEIEVDEKVAQDCGLTLEEYQKILQLLGRKPTYTEIGIFGVMWSEHCSYKNSIKMIKTLPRTGPQLLVSAGEENAGAVDIGNGYAICFKIESHNHPSAVEPFQGAATGVGGILRDIFSMGARPIAVLDSLRFGNINLDKTKFLLKGVVSGIAHYGNCFGVPTVGGEVFFEDCYNDNPLVNVMAVGIVRTDRLAFAKSKGVGNPVCIVGSSTGRDGIHGASLLASQEFTEDSEDMRPTVQVGDPFAEKLLLEATLELIKSGVVVGVQDMGAAGISCSTSEMSARGRTGMKINLNLVPLREPDMTPYEIMLSESQERMLFVFDKNHLDKAIEICKKWDVPIAQIGEVTEDGILHIWKDGKKVAEIEADNLVLGGKAPQYDQLAIEPKYLEELHRFDFSQLNLETINIEESFIKVFSSPNIISKRWVYEQYDHQVRTNTVRIVGDAAVLRLKELPPKGIALTTDCNSRYVFLNPYRGAVIAVAEAARNVACVGAKPIAITNCLNFGNPYNPEVYWTFKQAVIGMGDACRFFDTPVTGGNVSFHNESQNYAIFPTPTIGMLGIIDDVSKICSLDFKNEGDLIYLIGENKNEELGGSEFLKIMFNLVTGNAPTIDLVLEKKLIEFLITSIQKGLITSAHDCSEGGLAICLAEMSVYSNNYGALIELDETPNVGLLFNESQGRVVVTVPEENEQLLVHQLNKYNLPFKKIGVVVKDIFEIKKGFKFDVKFLKDIYFNQLEKILG
ncbi:MAG: Phosphoribosylformylglycinamidine synthase, synthetase subunit [Candidatus Kapaibacterium sp.]|nr:MAG: Phosphoribosylformylglycinamidine synthase, synthetase subunit [Candidatus Kapabacteria bacterium]